MKIRIFTKVISFILMFTLVLSTAVFAKSDISPVREISAVFGESSTFKGLNAYFGTDGRDPYISKDPAGWVLRFRSGDFYIHIDVDDNILYGLEGEAVEIEVDYYDKGNGVFTITYDGYEKNETDAEFVDLTNTGEWKTHTFFIQDALFTNRLNGDSDFRIAVSSKFLKSANSSDGRDNIIFGAVRVKKAEVKTPVHMNISSEALGNIFFEGEKARMTVDYTNKCDEEYKLSALVQAVDINNVVHWENNEELTFAPKEKKSVTYEFDIDKFNLYWLRVTLTDDEESVFCINDAEFYYVTTNHGTRLNYDVGTTSHAETYLKCGDYTKVLPLIQKAGYGRDRLPINWISVYSGSGDYAVPQYFIDVMELTQKLGLKQTVILSHAHNRFPYRASDPAYQYGTPTEEFLEENRKYVEAVVDASRKYADSYIMGNEAELEELTTGENTAKWFKNIYTKVKSMYPEAKVLGYGLTFYKLDYFVDSIKAGANNYFDMISAHPYATTATAESSRFLERIQTYWDAANKATGAEFEPAWIGELGHYHLRNAGLSPHEISQQFPRYYIYVAASDLIDTMIDYCANNATPSAYGHLRGGDEEKSYDYDIPYAAYREYLTIAAWNKNFGGDSDFVENKDTQNTRVYKFKRRSDGKDFIAMWCLNGRENITLDLGCNEISYMDILGNEEKMYSDDGRYTFNLSQDIKYIIGNFSKFEVCNKPKYSLNAMALDVVKESSKELTLTVDGNETEGYTLSGKGYMRAKPTSSGSDDASGLGVTITDLAQGYTEKYLCGNAGRSQFKLFDMLDIRDVVSVDVMKDGKLYARFEVPLTEIEVVKVNVDISPISITDASNWQTTFDVVNQSAEDIQGTFKVTGPAEIAKIAEPVPMTLQAGETVSLTYPLPAAILGQRISFRSEFAENSGKTFEYLKNLESLGAIYTNTPPTIDGNIDSGEWILNVTGNISEESWHQLIETESYTGADDLSGTVNMMWDKENLYLAVSVKDDVHKQAYTDSGTWKADGLQMGFTAGEKPIGWTSIYAALNDDGTLHPWLAKSEDGTIEKGVISEEFMNLAIKRTGDITVYEMRISWDIIMPRLNITNFGDGTNTSGVEINDDTRKEAKSGESFRFSVLVNDDDGGGRGGYIEYGTGVSSGAYRSFSEVTLYGGND